MLFVKRMDLPVNSCTVMLFYSFSEIYVKSNVAFSIVLCSGKQYRAVSSSHDQHVGQWEGNKQVSLQKIFFFSERNFEETLIKTINHDYSFIFPLLQVLRQNSRKPKGLFSLHSP